MIDLSELPLPFRMQPGLRRVAQVQLTPLQAGSPLYLEKAAVFNAAQSRHSLPDFDCEPALRAIAGAAHLPASAFNENSPLELTLEEDFAVFDARTGTLPWMCICTPSHWAPEDKLGLSLAALHAPVADNAALLAAMVPMAALITGGACWERWVWSLGPSARYDQHPRRHVRQPWPAELSSSDLASHCFVRVERQQFFPVQGPALLTGSASQPNLRQAVFSIHVRLKRLDQAVQTPAQATRLHYWLASMTPAVLDYKCLSSAREPLLAWLRDRAA